jgi:hypothetical protein
VKDKIKRRYDVNSGDRLGRRRMWRGGLEMVGLDVTPFVLEVKLFLEKMGRS